MGWSPREKMDAESMGQYRPTILLELCISIICILLDIPGTNNRCFHRNAYYIYNSGFSERSLHKSGGAL
jgi:hypothetical protein